MGLTATYFTLTPCTYHVPIQVYVTDHTLTEALQDPNEVTYCEVSCALYYIPSFPGSPPCPEGRGGEGRGGEGRGGEGREGGREGGEGLLLHVVLNTCVHVHIHVSPWSFISRLFRGQLSSLTLKKITLASQ